MMKLNQLEQMLSQFNLGLSNTKRVIFVSAIAGSMISEYPVLSMAIPVTTDTLKQIMTEVEGVTILNFIRHPATLELLNKLLGLQLQPNSGEYVVNEGDLLIMVSLSQRNQTSNADVNVTNFNQLVIRLVPIHLIR